MRKIHWVAKSNDKKTGKVMVSYSPPNTCPDTCNLKDGGCYAWDLFYIKALGRKVDSGICNRTLDVALKGRDKNCKIARHRVAGDIVGDVKSTIMECKKIEENELINIGYTHAWKDNDVQPLKRWFRASCQTVDEAIEARDMGWSVSLIVPKDSPRKIVLPNNEIAVGCPAETNPNINCNNCKLCRVDNKTKTKAIMFRAHGNNATMKKIKNKVGEI